MSTTTSTDPVTRAPAVLAHISGSLGALAAGQWWQSNQADLMDVLSTLGRIRHELARVEVHAAAEVIERRMPQDRSLSAVDYLTQATARHAPTAPVGHTLMMVRLAEALNDLTANPGLGTGPDPAGARTSDTGWDECDPTEAGGAGAANPDEPLAATVAAFESGVLGPSRAAAIARFHKEVAPHSDKEPLAEAMAGINEQSCDTHHLRGNRLDPLGIDHDPGSVIRRHGLTDRELSMVLGHARRVIKPRKQKDDDERRGRAFRALHRAPIGDDLTEYRLVVGPEATAIVEAALSALSAPAPAEDGTPDPRTAPQRKADALIGIIQRGVAAPQGTTRTTKAQVMVVIPYADLLNSVGAGTTMTGQVLSPLTVRRIACDAGIIPAVLGTDGQILEMGRTRRWFTPAQQRVLWHRDTMCTFPGCTMPPQWCDAHHIEHWVDGGRTDLTNAALLCPRHHTYVHTHELTATATATEVTWHT